MAGAFISICAGEPSAVRAGSVRCKEIFCRERSASGPALFAASRHRQLTQPLRGHPRITGTLKPVACKQKHPACVVDRASPPGRREQAGSSLAASGSPRRVRPMADWKPNLLHYGSRRYHGSGSVCVLEVERVVLNALAKKCGFGCRIFARTANHWPSSSGEADPPRRTERTSLRWPRRTPTNVGAAAVPRWSGR